MNNNMIRLDTMKMIQKNKMVTLSLLLLLAIVFGCQSRQKDSAAVICAPRCELDVPRVVFVSTEHDFGKLSPGEKKTCSFDFVNDGGKDLVIEKIHASCGCTTTVIENMIIKPGQASEISVTYRAGSFGKSKKQVMVYTNDPGNRQIALWISAEVLGSSKDTTAAIRNPVTSTPQFPQPPKETMPKGLKQALRDLDKATGG